MKAIKTILFGCALILFGFFCLYAGIAAEWGIIQMIGLLSPFIGVAFAIYGFAQRED